MNGAALAVAVALPGAAAWLLLGPAPAGPAGSILAAAGRAGAAAVLGLGASGLLAFGWLLGGGGLDGRYVAADALAFAGAALALAWRRRRARSEAPAAAPAGPGGAAAAVLAPALLGLALLAAAVALHRTFDAAPHGGWDAWAVWNQRARALYRAGDAWRAVLSEGAALGQPGYPLGLPLVVARLHAYAGEATAAPQLAAALFTLAAPCVLAAAVARRAGPAAGGSAGLLLLATPGWVGSGALEYADVPVATLLLLGAAAAGPVRERAAAPGAALAGGLALGLAGFTKNEGLAGAAWIFLAWGALAWSRRGARAAARELAAVAAGAALPALAWAAFEAGLSPEPLNVYAGGLGPGAAALARAVEPGRWARILSALPPAAPGAGLWLPVVGPALALALGLRAARLAASPAPWAALGMLLQVLVVFAVTPHPLAWHLETALGRLLLQPWPLLLLGLLGAAGRPAPAPPGAAAAEAV